MLKLVLNKKMPVSGDEQGRYQRTGALCYTT